MTIIIQMESRPEPIIMVLRRPILSRKSAGMVLPIGNIRLTKPATRIAVCGSMPTFSTRTDGM